MLVKCFLNNLLSVLSDFFIVVVVVLGIELRAWHMTSTSIGWL